MTHRGVPVRIPPRQQTVWGLIPARGCSEHGRAA